MQNSAAAMENSMEIPQKKLKIELPYDLAISLQYIFAKYFKSRSQGLFTLHCSLLCTVHNSQDAEIVHQWMNK